MRPRTFVALAAVAAAFATGASIAGHVTQTDPTTVPTGFLAAHNVLGEAPVSSFARAVKPDGSEVYVQHVRLGPNGATGWHTHPGLALVQVVGGALTYEDAAAQRCRRITYAAGTGFADPGFGHVHRAIAGPSGADFYVVYILPRGSANHLITAPAPRECAS